MTEKIPFVDLHAQYESIKDEIDNAIQGVIDNSQFVRGPRVEQFESEFAAAMQRQHCVSCANGTDALYIAMRALGVKPGDEVLAPAHSWISTTQTITQAGGKVVFCDTHPDTYTICPKDMVRKITPHTVGVIPVHLFGQPADMDAIMKLASANNLWVLEDCAQAHLATYRGQQVGTFGNAATFSFYPGKNLGAMGDAGAIVTNDSALANRMAMFARHGGLRKGDHQIEGINSRMDGLQAAVLSVKLRHLPEWTRLRQGRATRYTRLLADVAGIDTPVVAEGVSPVWHLYVVRNDRRDQLAAHLGAAGVATVINYPVALPFLPAYERHGHTEEQFPNASAHQSTVLSLPIFPELSDVQMDRIVSLIKDFAEVLANE